MLHHCRVSPWKLYLDKCKGLKQRTNNQKSCCQSVFQTSREGNLGTLGLPEQPLTRLHSVFQQVPEARQLRECPAASLSAALLPRQLFRTCIRRALQGSMESKDSPRMQSNSSSEVQLIVLSKSLFKRSI